MASVAYRAEGTPIRPAEMNLLWGCLDGKFDRLFGGRSFALIADGFTTQILPPKWCGYPVFFNSGRPTIYSQLFPGARIWDAPVTDPTNGNPVTGTGVRPYDHAPFEALAAAATLEDYDTNKRIAGIADIPQASYPAGYTKANAIGVFMHSLEPHTRTATAPGDNQERTYYLREKQKADKEGGSVWATKKWRYAVAEIVIEDIEAVVFPTKYRTYSCIRLHNLQAKPCEVSLAGVKYTLKGWECQAFRRNPREEAWRRSPFRYFWEYEDGDADLPADERDPRCFWFHASTPSFEGDSVRTGFSSTPAASMQANNLTNPALLYEWIMSLSAPEGQAEPDIYASLIKDYTQLCNIGPTYAAKFDTTSSDPIVGDMVHHQGTIIIKRRSRTLLDPLGFPLVTTEQMTFRGYGTIQQDFAPYMIGVEENAAGRLVLTNLDPDNDVDLIPVGTNLLKSVEWGMQTNTMGKEKWLQTAVQLSDGGFDSPFTLERNLFENATVLGNPFSPNMEIVGQDPEGRTPFKTWWIDPLVGGLTSRSTYRVWNSNFTAQNQSRTYVDVNGQVQTVALDPVFLRTFVATGRIAGKEFSRLHATRRSAVSTLEYFTPTGLPPVTDANVQWLDPTWTLTPEGWVLTFKEHVRIDALPAPAGDGPLYYNPAGRRYKLNVDAQRWEMVHVVRFRKHGFGYGQHGMENVAFFPPTDSRLISADWVDEMEGGDGGDFRLPRKSITQTGVRVLTQIDAEKLGSARRGGYLLMSGQSSLSTANIQPNQDGLLQFTLLAGQASYWAQYRQEYLDLNQSQKVGGIGGRRITSMPLSVQHYNAMAQAVNQCTTGYPLDYRCMQFLVGNRRLRLDWRGADGETVSCVKHWAAVFGSTLPAPMKALFCVPQDATWKPYWDYWMAEQGLSLDTQLPPSHVQFRTTFSQTRTIDTTFSGAISNAAFSGSIVINEGAFGLFHFATIDADVNWSMTPFAFSAPTNIEQGLASVCVHYVGEPTNFAQELLSPTGIITRLAKVNLATAYAGKSWLAAKPFAQWCALSGFKMLHAEVVVPVALDYFEIQPLLVDDQFGLTNRTGTYHGRIGGVEDNRTTSPPPTAASAKVVAYVSRANAVTESRAVSTAPFLTRAIAFQLAESEARAEWKLPAGPGPRYAPAQPPQTFWRDDRTQGAYRMRTVGVFKHGVFQVSTLANGNGAIFLRFNIPAPLLPGGVNGSPGGPTFLNTIPFFPADSENHAPQNNQNTGPGFNPASIVTRREGARQSMDFAIPSAEDERLRADRYYAWLNKEQHWLACNIVEPDGLGAKQQFYFSPSPVFGFERDWWVEDADTYAMASIGIRPGAAGTPGADDPLRNVNLPEAEVIDAVSGVTMLRPRSDSAAKLVYDPVQITVGL